MSDPVPDIDVMFAGGANSFSDPRLPQGHYVRGWNVINRGGVIQTRPGTETVVNLPDGKLQGVTYFSPRRGPTQLVAVVDGNIYISEFPFRSIYQLPGISMDPVVRHVHFAHTEQVVQRNADDSLTLLPVPRRVLVIQDGFSPATWYDGADVGVATGFDTIPQGTAMAWSGHRLWVARDNQVFASDFANPFSFVEQFYLGGTDSFFAPGRITAMAEIEGTGEPQLLVFTEQKTITVQSNVQNRSLWLQTPNFIRTLFPQVGCSSHRSIVQHFGNLWWYSQHGLISFDLAEATNVTSLFPTADNEMLASKAYANRSEGSVASTSFENFMLVSVPYGGRYNVHTWVLDEAANRTMRDRGFPAWAGMWTGFWPVEWTRFVVDGRERVFAAVTDGTHNQIIELNTTDRRDSGQDIECSVEMRVLTHGVVNVHEYRYAELFLSDIHGDLDFRVDWRGFERGPYKQCLGKRVKASRGCFRFDSSLSASSLIFATRGQSRRLWTEDIKQLAQDEFSSCGVEHSQREGWDYGFQLFVSWSGRASLRDVKLSATSERERNVGKCEPDEESERFVRFDGKASPELAALELPLPIFESTQLATGAARGTSAMAAMTSYSLVSQAAADKQAQQAAAAQVARDLFDNAPPVYSSDPP